MEPIVSYALERIKRLIPLERLLYWISERDSIRIKRKEGLPKPWTADPILQNYRFCNVRRMDDKVSQWFLECWYDPYFNHPNMLIACTIARHFNRPESMGPITRLVFTNKYSPTKIMKVLRDLRASGVSIFTGAYMVRGIGTADKTEMVIDRICEPLRRKPPVIDTGSMQATVEALLPYWGFAPFIAGQVVADLRWAMQGSWTDAKTWAPLGPGSKRGMNILLGRDPESPLKQDEFLKNLRALILEVNTKLPTIAKRLEAIDVQNCLCEYSKYHKALFGIGRPKQRYNGT